MFAGVWPALICLEIITLVNKSLSPIFLEIEYKKYNFVLN